MSDKKRKRKEKEEHVLSENRYKKWQPILTYAVASAGHGIVQSCYLFPGT